MVLVLLTTPSKVMGPGLDRIPGGEAVIKNNRTD